MPRKLDHLNVTGPIECDALNIRSTDLKIEGANIKEYIHKQIEASKAIKGEKGPRGPPGPEGKQGPVGPSAKSPLDDLFDIDVENLKDGMMFVFKNGKFTTVLPPCKEHCKKEEEEKPKKKTKAKKSKKKKEEMPTEEKKEIDL